MLMVIVRKMNWERVLWVLIVEWEKLEKVFSVVCVCYIFRVICRFMIFSLSYFKVRKKSLF